MVNAPTPGTVFDQKYEIVSVLGAGGVGTVYKALELGLNREVAIKVLNLWTGSEDQFVALQRFRREARALCQLQHPGILQVYRFGCEDIPFLVTEFVQAESLRDILEKSGALPYGIALQVAAKLAEALQYAHKQGVVHRDLKPENILINLQQNPPLVKLIDFGLCKPDSESNSGSHTLTVTGELVGTAAYMSPEQVKGKKLDERTDIYSYACLLFEIFSGKQAMIAPTLPELLLKQINDPLPELLDLNPECGLPIELDELIRDCSKKDSNSRVQNFDKVLATLKELRIDKPQKRFELAKQSAKLRKQNKKLMISCISLAVLLVVLFGGFSLFSYLSTPSQSIELSSSAVKTVLDAKRIDAAQKLALTTVESQFFRNWPASQQADLFYRYFKLFRSSGEINTAQTFLVGFLKVALPLHKIDGSRDEEFESQIREIAEFLFREKISRRTWKEIAVPLNQMVHIEAARPNRASVEAWLILLDIREEAELRSWETPPDDVARNYCKKNSTMAVQADEAKLDSLFERFWRKGIKLAKERNYMALQAHLYAIKAFHQLRRNELSAARDNIEKSENLLHEAAGNPDQEPLKFSSLSRVHENRQSIYESLAEDALKRSDKENLAKYRLKLKVIQEDFAELHDAMKEDRQTRDDLFDATFK